MFEEQDLTLQFIPLMLGHRLKLTLRNTITEEEDTCGRSIVNIHKIAHGLCHVIPDILNDFLTRMLDTSHRCVFRSIPVP